MTQADLPQTIHGVGRMVTQLTGSETLLTYSLMTTPAPVQVSPQAGPPSVAALTFVVSCPVDIGQATVTQIAFNLPVGTDSGSLTNVGGGISPSVSSSGPDSWQIGPGAAPGSFVLTPGSGQPGTIDAQGLTVALTGIQVSPVVGTAPVNVVEQALADGHSLETRVTGIAVPKFPYGFQAGNFAPDEPLVQHGGRVTLTWVGSTNAAYTVFWGTGSQVVTDVRTWTSPALVDTTTFILEVKAQEAGETVTQDFSTTVIVADPDLTATSLTVLTTSTLQGGVTVGATANPADLTVNGAGSLASLSVSGTANLTDGLSVTGGANITGSVGINTNTPIAALTLQTGSQPPNAIGNASNGLLISAGPQSASINLGIYDSGATDDQYGWIQSAYTNQTGFVRNLKLNPLGGYVSMNTSMTVPVAPLTVGNFAALSYPPEIELAVFRDGCYGSSGSVTSTTAAIHAQGPVMATALYAFADERIKANQEVADGSRDLDLLKGLSVKDYQLRDHVAHGGAPQKGLLGQEVEKVFPQAVRTGTDHIPSVFAPAKGTSLSGGVLTIAMGDDHGLVTGDTVRLITGGNRARDCLVQVADERTFDVHEWDGEEEGVFVYGKKVDDFRSVDYQQVFCLGISAIQALSKQLDDATRRIERLEREQMEAGSGLQKTLV
jgi:hypothetical protein